MPASDCRAYYASHTTRQMKEGGGMLRANRIRRRTGPLSGHTVSLRAFEATSMREARHAQPCPLAAPGRTARRQPV